MINFKLGILTLGQSPRDDIIPTFESVLGEGVTYIQSGALDKLTPYEIEQITTNIENIGIETRLLSGESILVRKESLIKNLTEKAIELDEECDKTVLLCSGRFPALKRSTPNLIQPIEYLHPLVKAAASDRCLCIVGPDSDMAMAPYQWRDSAQKIVTAAASPYEQDKKLKNAAKIAKESGAELIFMDDMGFTEAQRLLIRETSGLTTINATSMFARIIEELL